MSGWQQRAWGPVCPVSWPFCHWCELWSILHMTHCRTCYNSWPFSKIHGRCQMSGATCGVVVYRLWDFYEQKRAKVLFRLFNKAYADLLLYFHLGGNAKYSLHSITQSILHRDSDSDWIRGHFSWLCLWGVDVHLSIMTLCGKDVFQHELAKHLSQRAATPFSQFKPSVNSPWRHSQVLKPQGWHYLGYDYIWTRCWTSGGNTLLCFYFEWIWLRTQEYTTLAACQSQESHALTHMLLHCLFYCKWDHNLQNEHAVKKDLNPAIETINLYRNC